MSIIQGMMSNPQQMNRMGGGPMGGQNPMMQMIMQMMKMMMAMMMQQMGGQMGGQQGCGMPGMGGAPGAGGGFSPMQSPGFGGGGGQGGGMPSMGGMGGGNPLGNFMGQGGGASPVSRGGGGYGAGQNDSYVPGGTSALGGPPNITGAGQGANAVRWALSKEGISERNNPGAVRAISRGRWQPWCADFVSQALKASGGSAMGHQSSVQGILNWGRKNNKFMSAGAARNNPGALRPGDVVVWKTGRKSHVGLFTGMNKDGTFNTIEGNTGDAVRRRTHSFGNGLTGFVRAAKS